MKVSEYQELAMRTCLESSNNPLYMLFELGEEFGELYGKFSKPIRKSQIKFNENELITSFSEEELEEWKTLVKKEVGDVLWGLAGFCKVMGWNLEDIAGINISKLSSRQERGKIEGDGDNR